MTTTWAPPPSPPPAPGPPAIRPGRGLLWLQRAWMLAFAGVTVGQPVLAGAYLQGDYDAIGLHGVLGSAALPLGAMGATALAALSVLVARGSLWPVPLGVVLFLAIGVQIGFGHSRSLLVHVPLGVGIVAAVLGWTAWVCSPAGGRPRRWGRGR